jgi:hypothetical protein
VLLADNSLRRSHGPPDADWLAAAATAQGREELAKTFPSERPRRYIRWGRVFSLVVFLALTLAPLAKPTRRKNDMRVEKP